MRFAYPAYFRKQTLTRATPTLVPDECLQRLEHEEPRALGPGLLAHLRLRAS